MRNVRKIFSIRNLTAEQFPHYWYLFGGATDPKMLQSLFATAEISANGMLLDPFCGTGGVLIESQKRGIKSVGIDTLRIMGTIAEAKTNWSVNVDHIRRCRDMVYDALIKSPQYKEAWLSPSLVGTLLKQGTIEPRLLEQCLTLSQMFKKNAFPSSIHKIGLLALLRVTATKRCKEYLQNHGLAEVWRDMMSNFADQFEQVQQMYPYTSAVRPSIWQNDSRNLSFLKNAKFSTVVTVPPNPNEKDQTKFSRLAMILAEYLVNSEQLLQIKPGLFRCNSRCCYSRDTNATVPRSVINLMTELAYHAKTKFSYIYPRVLRYYSIDMLDHLTSLQQVLVDGANLYYFVRDQNSFCNIPISTDKLFCDLAKSAGYTHISTTTLGERHIGGLEHTFKQSAVHLQYKG